MNLPTSMLIATALTIVRIVEPPLPADPDAVDRFLSQKVEPVASAVTFRHLEATTRGGSMRGWIDACTVVDGSEMRYEIVGQGGSGSVRSRALIAALEGEAKARRNGETGRANLHPDNYRFSPGDASDGLVRVSIVPRRNDSMLVRGSMYLAPEDGDLVRVEGALVKAPSMWTRRVRVDRRYARVAGIRVPVSMKSTAHVFVVGESTFSMDYSYLAINGAAVADPRAPEQARACMAASTGPPGKASERREASHASGAGQGAPASERVGESEGRSPSDR